MNFPYKPWKNAKGMSAIFYHDDDQKKAAEESMISMKSKQTGKPITTLILPADKFFVAEE